MKKDESSKKKRHSLRDSIHEFQALLSYVWRWKKSVFAMIAIYMVSYTVMMALQVYLPKAVLAELENRQTIQHLFMVLGVISVFLIGSILLSDHLVVRLRNNSFMLQNEMMLDYIHKLLYTEYANLENMEFITKRDTAKAQVWGENIGEENVSADLSNFLMFLNTVSASILSIAFYAVALGSQSLFIAAAVFVTGIGIFAIFSQSDRRNYQYNERISAAWRKAKYATDRAGDFSMAKDVRLYQMEGWLTGVTRKYMGIRQHYKGVVQRFDAEMEALVSVCVAIQRLSIYGYLIYEVLYHGMPASDLVLYAGMAEALSQGLNVCFSHMQKIKQMSFSFACVQEFLQYGQDAKETALLVKKEKATLKLEHVSFRFPGMEKDVLHDLNFEADSAEKLAIVGVNRAGKTTLMKLICGLLTPTEGRILLNGKDLGMMTSDERYTWFSCAFQDVSFLPVTVQENISMCTAKETDAKKVVDCLLMAGMKEKVEELPKGLQERMEKNINEDAVDFSGGERQKLILARALYRDASVLILDEPTAALDPLAENELYQKYAEFAKGKTSFFVSHRLSSTSFCDRILLLDGGRIAEDGTHQELIEKGGLYAEMFELQSHYYKEGMSQEGRLA